MVVAEVVVLTVPGWISAAHASHTLHFESLDAAEAEYGRVAGLLRKREEKANDLPASIEMIGVWERVTVPLADVRSVGLTDYATANRQRSGMKEAFPNLF